MVCAQVPGKCKDGVLPCVHVVPAYDPEEAMRSGQYK
jgi:hypothetical protein